MEQIGLTARGPCYGYNSRRLRFLLEAALRIFPVQSQPAIFGGAGWIEDAEFPEFDGILQLIAKKVSNRIRNRHLGARAGDKRGPQPELQFTSSRTARSLTRSMRMPSPVAVNACSSQESTPRKQPMQF